MAVCRFGFLSLAMFAACAGGSASAPAVHPAHKAPPAAAATTPAPAPGPVERSLIPAELDPAADKYPAPQYAYLDVRAPRADKLVIYLIGANNTPERGRAMGAFLAGLGFPVVVPGYPNDYDIRKLCESPETPDRGCHGKLRFEAFLGKDMSPHIDITRPNSLEERVIKMLGALATRHPHEGWGQYLDRGQPRWPRVILAGHSHGASSSAIIGKIRNVSRVVMLSGPFDNRGGEPAPWLRQNSVTPLDRYWAFSHTREVQYPGHIKNWDALGLQAFGQLALVDDAAPPFGGSHQLATAVVPATDKGEHGTTTAGKASPLLPDGSYRFTAVWRHLFGIAP